MNEYENRLDYARHMLESLELGMSDIVPNDLDKDSLEREIRICEFLATCDEKEIQNLFCHSCGWWISKAVLSKIALKELVNENVITESQSQEIIKKFVLLGDFDTQTTQKDIRIDEFLKSCDVKDIIHIHAIGTFNKYAKEYLEIVLNNLLEEKTINKSQAKAIKKMFSFSLGANIFLNND